MPSSSHNRAHTPPSLHRQRPRQPSSTTPPGSSYFTFPLTYSVNGLLRRFSGDDDVSNTTTSSTSRTKSNSHSPHRSTPTTTTSKSLSSSLQWPSTTSSYLPAPQRTASPFQPPPLTALTLAGWKAGTKDSAKLLSKALAEEIRLLVPARLQLVADWALVFSLEQDGVSLATLYQKCDAFRGKRGGFVLVVKDEGGGIFGTFLTDAPHPSPHFYGTGECFLWRAHLLPAIPALSALPPPPSADTTHATRATTLAGAGGIEDTPGGGGGCLRFKAFPYSGVNDYLIFCQSDYLSVGGGDGHYGLWLDDSLDTGVSSSCPTFGNEPLSDEGAKFDVLGVEIWYIGA